MIGREDKKCNDLFYVCSLIDYIARQTTNKRSYIVNTLGKAKIEKIYDTSAIKIFTFHCRTWKYA